MCKPNSTGAKNVAKTEERTESATGGVEAMAIVGRMASERERCIGMTPEERAWRAQWVKDQILEPDEPTLPEGYYEARYNPIRRFYRAPMERFERALGPRLGLEAAETIRHITSKTLMGIGLLYLGFYYFKYNTATWMGKGSWKVSSSRNTVIPGDPDWPNHEDKLKANQYWTQGFENSPI